MLSSVLITGALGYPLTPDRSFSENENRILAKPPEFSTETVFSGKFTEGLENYLSDQIAGRDDWMTSVSNLRISAGLKNINSVYLSDKDYLIDRFTDEDIPKEQFESNIAALKDFCSNSNTKVTVMPVPDKSSVLSEFLPYGAASYDYDKSFEALQSSLSENNLICLLPALKNASKTQQVFFRTDHHWTSQGAAVAYDTYRQKLSGRISNRSDNYTYKTVSDDFLGSLYSKVLSTNIRPDKMELPDIKMPKNLHVVAGGKETDNIYDYSYLKKKDKYRVFLGGNFNEIIIQTGSDKTNKKLLIIKDSFANSIVPFMLEDYSEIRLIDLRYYIGSIHSYIIQNQPDEVLILYQMTNIIKDENIPKLAT